MAQRAAGLNVVIVAWNDTTATITSVTDTAQNVYQLAVGPTTAGANATQSIYYAKNIAATAAGNTVTVAFDGLVNFPDLRILEYGGIDPLTPLDAAIGSSGNSDTSSSGSLTTTDPGDLLVAGSYVAVGVAATDPAYTLRVLTSPDRDIAADRIVNAAGPQTATARLDGSGWWVMQLVAFRPVDTQPPAAPANLTAAAVSGNQIDVTWMASTDNVGVTNYLVERCQGAGCSDFTQIGTTASASFQDTGLTTGTSYSYRVRATDAAGNQSAYSTVASATTTATTDTTPPTAPTNLTATAISPTQIGLTWTPSTDNVSVTSYLVESCQGAGCSSFAQVGTSSSATFSDTGLTPGTSYSYRVRASDAAGNLGSYSAVATVTTAAGTDAQPPTAPTGLTATAASSEQINLVWAAATDNVGVTGYLVERCLGAGCSSFAQVGTSSSATFSDTGLAAGTSYSYRVRASDAAGNLGGYSNAATATTTAVVDTTPPSAPSNLVATGLSARAVSLAWTASMDDVGVTGYLVERCQGANCTAFVQVGTAPGPAFTDNGLLPSTSYSYRVRATDAAMNLSTTSNIATASTSALPPPAEFVQCSSATPSSPQSAVTITFTGAQAEGDLNVVFAAWSDSVTTVSSVTDSAGNVYVAGLPPTIYPGTATEVAYYAKNIAASAAGSNAITITFNGMAPSPDVRIAEYSGLDTTDPFDAASGLAGDGALATSGPIQTSAPADLLVGANYAESASTGAGPGSTLRLLTPDTDVLEDDITYLPGYYPETVSLQDVLGWWIMQGMAFRVASPSLIDTTPPTVVVTSPAAAVTVSGTVTVTIDAEDATAVQGVQLMVDGIPMQAPVNVSPYSVSFSSALFTNGAHNLQAYAWDPFLNVGYSAAVSVTFSNTTSGNPVQDGIWTGVLPSPVVSTASALLPGGNVLTWDGQSYGFDARVWNPRFNSFTAVPSPVNIFCSGVQQMADGRILVAGGHVKGHTGITALTAFNPTTNAWSVLADMANPRWYPTATTLPDGRVIVLSGETNCDNCDVTTPEIYDPIANTTTQLTGSQFFFNFFPHVFVIPDGRVLVSSTIEAPTVSQVLDLTAGTWTPIGGPVVDGGTAVMYLPGKVLKAGNSFDPNDPVAPAAATAYVLDATQASPTWQPVAPMNKARSYQNLTMLPDGTVLVVGGGPTTAGTDTANAILTPEIWSPDTQTFTALGSTMNAPRLYHFSSLLMPDGRVLAIGGGRFDDVMAPTDQYSAEFFAPPYMFKGPRPVITSAPTTLQYGQPFSIATADAPRVGQVSLIRYGATTHTFNMGQVFVPLGFTAGTNALTVTAPPNANIAPPGNYLLFILDTNGIPSVAATVHF